eukprot:1482790-Rhodomonas_salina.1
MPGVRRSGGRHVGSESERRAGHESGLRSQADSESINSDGIVAPPPPSPPFPSHGHHRYDCPHVHYPVYPHFRVNHHVIVIITIIFFVIFIIIIIIIIIMD